MRRAALVSSLLVASLLLSACVTVQRPVTYSEGGKRTPVYTTTNSYTGSQTTEHQRVIPQHCPSQHARKGWC